MTGLMDKERQRIEKIQDDTVSNELVEKRNIINLITKETNADIEVI